MGTRADGFLISDDLDNTDQELLEALGFTGIERVESWEEADFGFIRFRGHYLMFFYDKYAAVVHQAIEQEDAHFPQVLTEIFAETNILAVTLQSSTGLAGFGLRAVDGTVRRWAAADDHGVFVDSGVQHPAESEARAASAIGEEIVHAVTRAVFGYDLLDVFDARTTGECSESLFKVAGAA